MRPSVPYNDPPEKLPSEFVEANNLLRWLYCGSLSVFPMTGREIISLSEIWRHGPYRKAKSLECIKILEDYGWLIKMPILEDGGEKPVPEEDTWLIAWKYIDEGNDEIWFEHSRPYGGILLHQIYGHSAQLNWNYEKRFFEAEINYLHDWDDIRALDKPKEYFNAASIDEAKNLFKDRCESHHHISI